MLRGQLPERGGVEVEPFQPDPHLVGPQIRARVEALRGLREHARRLDHAVQADR
jgi:hypothetical protein